MKTSLRQIIVLFVGLNFVILSADAFIGHFVGGIRHPLQWGPILFGPIATILTMIAGWKMDKFWLRIFGIVCAVSIIVGLEGFLLHGLRIARSLQWPITNVGQLIFAIRYPPLLAPMAFAGFGILGLFIFLPFNSEK